MNLLSLFLLYCADVRGRMNDTSYNLYHSVEAIVTGAIEGLVDLFGASAGLSVAS